jgi:transcriptional regulator with XRE-family HTH domain
VELAEIGERIRAARKERGWTQSRLAIAANASRARIDAIENGRAADFGVRGLLQMLGALNLDLTIGPENRGRPTLDDLAEELQNAPRLGR